MIYIRIYTLSVMFDHVNNKLPVSFDNVFPLNKDVQINYETRQSNLMYIDSDFCHVSVVTFHYMHYPKYGTNGQT